MDFEFGRENPKIIMLTHKRATADWKSAQLRLSITEAALLSNQKKC